MESRLTCFGSGFVTLTMGNQRLAYLMCKHDLPPQPVHPSERVQGIGEGELTLNVFELWNRPLWEQITRGGDPYGALRMQARYGNLKMLKIVKSPLETVRARRYDIVHSRWQIDGDEYVEIDPAKMQPMVKQFKVSYASSQLEQS